MDTQTEYKIVEGYQVAFEIEINELAKKGWLYCSGFNTIYTEKDPFHSVLMSRLIPKEQNYSEVQDI